MEVIHLAGAEEVARAASTMASAAREITQAASTMEYALQRQRDFMDDWLRRFEEAMSRGRGGMDAGPL